MRYALRNQHKIKAAYGNAILQRILDSLNEEFNNKTEIEIHHENKNEKYGLIAVNDVKHTCGVIMFYVLSIKYDVYKLAFKEFIS